ncbi:MAG: DUF2231 domain-containing protein [Thermodesulfobacteriota bacterium]
MFDALFPGLQHLQNIHPLVVHFPIAFLIGAGLLYLFAWTFNRDKLSFTAFMLLILGTLSAGAAVGTGLYAEDGVMISYSVREHLLNRHMYFMIATLGISVLLSIWALLGSLFPRKGRLFFILLFLILIGVMSLGGDYGARMVYDYNAGGNACPQPIEFTK